MKKSFLIPIVIVLTVACSRSPGPGDTYLEMQNKICEKLSLTPMMDYAAPESMALIGFIANLAEDEKKGTEIKEKIAENCKTGVKIIEEKIDGDIATLTVSNDKDTQTMRKVDGKWKLVLIKENKKSKGDGQTKDIVKDSESKAEVKPIEVEPIGVEPIEVAVCREKKMVVARKEFNIQSPEDEALIPESLLKEIEKSCGGKM